MTVKELIEELEDINGDLPISFDGKVLESVEYVTVYVGGKLRVVEVVLV